MRVKICYPQRIGVTGIINTILRIDLQLRMSRTILQLPLYAFMACIGTTLTLVAILAVIRK
jgi:hypothetical protein